MVISIIIPAYNAERFLSRCLSSVYHTTLPEYSFEVIAVNDGSRDNTISILHKYHDEHSNLKVINQPNGGVSIARNNGIVASSGDYVLFLDADDELIDGALAKVYAFLSEHEPMDMLVTRQIRSNGKQRWQLKAPTLEENKLYSGLEAYRNGYIRTNAGGGICRMAFLRKWQLSFPEGVKNAEDTIFFGHLQVYARSIVYTNLSLYLINEIDGSPAHNTDYTRLGKSHIISLHAVGGVKASLRGPREQKAIFDYVVYQLLANTIAYFSASKELSFKLFKSEVDLGNLLPLDTDYMFRMRNNAKLMNFSLPLFYYLSWFKHSLQSILQKKTKR